MLIRVGQLPLFKNKYRFIGHLRQFNAHDALGLVEYLLDILTLRCLGKYSLLLFLPLHLSFGMMTAYNGVYVTACCLYCQFKVSQPRV